jgi:hypothetical protein
VAAASEAAGFAAWLHADMYDIGSAQAAMEAVRALAASVTIIDDRGARYALTERGVSGEVRGTEMLVHLRVNPVPGPEAGWVELQGHDGTAARLFPSPRAIARAAQPRPAQVTAATWTAIAGAVLRADGPRLHRGIGVTLPEADGVSIHLDTLVSLPYGWHRYLHSARPRGRGRDGPGEPHRRSGGPAFYGGGSGHARPYWFLAKQPVRARIPTGPVRPYQGGHVHDA